ncbi:MAG: hypothetical protein FWE80_02855 [Oscillospiraceae bacterium]|nr:hypothetical protein [Oscillospiraceae bacterium]
MAETAAILHPPAIASDHHSIEALSADTAAEAKAAGNYQITNTTLITPDGVIYRTYGICGIDIAGAVIEFPDISPRKEAVAALIEWCNLLELAPRHLDDAVTDFLENDCLS